MPLTWDQRVLRVTASGECRPRSLDGSSRRSGKVACSQPGLTSLETVVIFLPSGQSLLGLGTDTDATLSAWLERPVRLVDAGDGAVPTFERQADDADDNSATATWQGHPGVFVDSSPVHLMTTASLRAVASQRPDLDWRVSRFRPNLLIDTPGDGRTEDAWVGRRCSVGDVELEIVKPCTRCVMVTRPQPDGVERQVGVLTHLSRAAEGTLGALARVVRPGVVNIGASVTVA